MSENSKIEWTDHTFNPWIGCTRVSPGCDHCYAAVSTPSRAMGVAWGPGEARHRTADSTWKQPLRWNARHAEFFATHGRRQRVFCASLADVFDNAVPASWLVELFYLIAKTPNLDWLLLTKRIGNAEEMIRYSLQFVANSDDPWPWANVWLGATIVNQAEADRDIPKLLMTPARRRFLSMEPLLGPVDLQAWFDPTGICCMQEMQSCQNCPAAAPWIHGPTTEYAEDGSGYRSPKIDWVIVGGESGRDARPMHPQWARDIRDQCAEYGVPFLFKQWGEWRHMSVEEQRENPAAVMRGRASAWPDGTLGHGDFRRNGGYGKPLFQMGKKAAGRELDGRTHDEFPRGVA